MATEPQLKTLFDEAVDLPASDRDALLARVAAENPALATQLRDLLDQLSLMPGAFLEAGETQPASRPLEQVGRYRILDELGRGGMGVVYLAEQDEPRRRVALKVIRHGELATDAVKRRFELEAAVLARLRHPGIAHVYDAGTASLNGEPVPYFAMELVEGEPIDAFVQRTKAPRRERLRLFARVCDAVEAAHAQGVVHRDLKPANILVTQEATTLGTQDPTLAGPSPKVLDFGVARIVDGEDQVSTMHTRAGDIIGTVGYMSPEQLAGRSDEVDARADVYALGVLLFRLLSGRMPYELQGLPLPQVVWQVHEEDPTRLANISTDLRGDLDAIVAKALERDLGRRYATAGALAADVRRHLDNEPIEAQPASRIYLARKFARRHRSLVTAVLVTTTALVLALAFTTRAYFASEKERASKEAALETSDAVVQFMSDMLRAPSPESGDRNVSMQEILRKAELDVDARFADRPGVSTRIKHALGYTLFELGEHERAQTQLEAVLNATRDRQDALHARHLLALIAFEKGDVDEAARIGRALAAELEGVTLDRHPLLLPRTLLVLSRTEAGRNRFDQAAALLDQADAIAGRTAPDDVEFRIAIGIKRAVLSARNLQWKDAIERYEGLLDRARAHFGPEHARTLTILGNLASAYNGDRQLDRALALTEESLTLHRRVFGAKHLYTVNNVVRKALILARQGKGQDALQTVEGEGYGALGVDPTSPEKVPLQLKMARGRALTAAGRPREAIPLLDGVLSRCRKAHASECVYYTSLALLDALQEADETARRTREAETLVQWLATTVGPEHPRTRAARARAEGRQD